MDAKKFGAFILQMRKENHMTQSQLAAKINVTDKAVSRWERGIGFPDIILIEQLANALDISILELMKSEQMPDENITKNSVDEVFHNSVNLLRQQEKENKTVTIFIAVFIVLICFFLIASHKASLLGSIIFCTPMAVALLSGYYYYRNRNDKESKKIYGTFCLLGIAVSVIGIILMIPEDILEAHSDMVCLLIAFAELWSTFFIMFSLFTGKYSISLLKKAVYTLILITTILLILFSFYQNIKQNVPISYQQENIAASIWQRQGTA